MQRRRCTQASPSVRHSSQPFDRGATGFTFLRCLQAMCAPFRGHHTQLHAKASGGIGMKLRMVSPRVLYSHWISTQGLIHGRQRVAPDSLMSGRTNERAARVEGARSRRRRGRLGIEGRRAVAGTCGRRADRARQAPRRGLRRRRRLHPLRWPPCGGDRRGRHHPVPLAPRAIRPAHRRSHAAGPRSHPLLSSRATERTRAGRGTSRAATDRAIALRTLADSKAIVARAAPNRRAVVIGASFIGLEVAASLRQRTMEVTVVAPEARPLERVLGPELGDFVRTLHEEHGVKFQLGRKPARIAAQGVALDDGTALPADLVVMGVGVRPRLQLAEQAGLRVDEGVLVDPSLRTSAEAVWAAGDIARFPDPRSGRPIRVEHWVVAERQGQHAARAMLGERGPYRALPLFWSQEYDVPVKYVGHAEGWDSIQVAGDVAGRNCLVAYRQSGRVQAVASVYRDRESLLIEAAMERGDDAAIEAQLRG